MKSVVLRFRAVDRDKFNDIINGRKNVETRAATVKYQNIQPGDILILTCGKDKTSKQVKKVEHYQSVEEMLAKIHFKDILPKAQNIDEAIKIFNSFSNYKEKIKKNGILAFYI